MSESPEVAVETPEVAADEVSAPVVVSGADEVMAIIAGNKLASQMLAMITEEWASEATTAKETLLAADPDAIEELLIPKRETHPAYADYQAAIAKADEVLAEIDAANLADIETPSDDEVRAATEVYDSAMAQAKAGIKLLELQAVKANGGKPVSLAEVLPEVFRKTAKGKATSATGQKRPRLDSAVITNGDGAEVKVWDKGEATFGRIAQYLNGISDAEVTTANAQEAGFSAAGTRDLSEAAGKPVTFSLAGHTVTVIPSAPKA